MKTLVSVYEILAFLPSIAILFAIVCAWIIIIPLTSWQEREGRNAKEKIKSFLVSLKEHYFPTKTDRHARLMYEAILKSLAFAFLPMVVYMFFFGGLLTAMINKEWLDYSLPQNLHEALCLYSLCYWITVIVYYIEGHKEHTQDILDSTHFVSGCAFQTDYDTLRKSIPDPRRIIHNERGEILW